MSQYIRPATGAKPSAIEPHTLQAALEALDEGLWPVPVYAVDSTKTENPGKAPIGQGWGLKRPTPKTLRARWAGHPTANVGLLLGAAGGVIDIDVDDPEAAAPVLARIFPEGEPATRGWSNAGGKRHLLFTWDDRLAAYGKTIIKGGSHYPGIEIRLGAPPGDRQQIQTVIPPSRLADGTPRRWNGHREILPPPPSLFADLDRHAVPPPPPPPAPPRPRGRGKGDVSSYANAAFDKELAALRAAGQGDRNRQLNRSAYSLGRLIGAGALDRGDVEQALTAAALALGLSQRETAATIASGIGSGIAEPRDLSGIGTMTTATPAVRNGHPTPEPEPEPERPKIIVTTEEHEVIDQAVKALAVEPNVYQRGNVLVTVLRDVRRRRKKELDRPPGTPRIAQVPMPRLREMLARRGRWIKQRRDKKLGIVEFSCHPTEWAVAGVAARGEWEDIRPIEGVIEAPTLRPDGSVLDTPGWDEETGLLYEPNGTFPAIPDFPTAMDAEHSAGLLLNVVADFPFADSAHRSAWLAATLTALARNAIEGPCPLFLVDSNTPGCGKGKLCHLIAILVTGRPMACSDYPEREEEMAKTLLSIALAADRMILFDNVESGFAIGGKSLDRALTAPTVKGRLLGRSEMTADLPMNTVFYATGNNIGLKGDALRRIVPIRLESPDVRPEARSDFKVKGDLLTHTLARRGELVAAGLTILRGYVVAGRPPQNLTPMDYPAWCNLIRNAVHWAIGEDPCKTRDGLIASDPETAERESIVLGWKQLCGAANASALTAAVGLEKIQTLTGMEDLREVLLEWSREPGKLPSARVVGNRFNKMRGRATQYGALDFLTDRGNRLWQVKPLRGGSGASGDSEKHATRESVVVGQLSDKKDFDGEDHAESHQSHQSHQREEEEIPF